MLDTDYKLVFEIFESHASATGKELTALRSADAAKLSTQSKLSQRERTGFLFT